MAAFWRAWSIWAVSVTATATFIAYNAIDPLPANIAAQQGGKLAGTVAIVFIGAFATVGAVLAWQRPRNPIGWLLSATALTFAAAGSGVLLAHFPRTLTSNRPTSPCGPGNVSRPRQPARRRGSRLQAPPAGACRRCARR